ncbi:MAG: SCO family protein [Bacteroidia bacterium]
MKKSTTNIILVFSAIVALGIGYFISAHPKPMHYLPYYGPKEVDSALVNGQYKRDTVYHRVGDFNVIDQSGKKISQKDFDNKIYVADFFFTTCQGQCLQMSSQMERVFKKYKNNSYVKFISYSVNPVGDSVPALAAYAKLHDADPNQWHLVTGDKKEIYDLARTSYFASVSQGDGGADDFLHPKEFSLVDKEKHIRGLYDGTDSTDINRMMVDIDLLLQAYAQKK